MHEQEIIGMRNLWSKFVYIEMAILRLNDYTITPE
jgi:hypothetical protein